MVIKQGQVYVCQKCGTQVQALRDAVADVRCCGVPLLARAPESG